MDELTPEQLDNALGGVPYEIGKQSAENIPYTQGNGEMSEEELLDVQAGIPFTVQPTNDPDAYRATAQVSNEESQGRGR